MLLEDRDDVPEALQYKRCLLFVRVDAIRDFLADMFLFQLPQWNSQNFASFELVLQLNLELCVEIVLTFHDEAAFVLPRLFLTGGQQALEDRNKLIHLKRRGVWVLDEVFDKRLVLLNFAAVFETGLVVELHIFFGGNLNSEFGGTDVETFDQDSNSQIAHSLHGIKLRMSVEFHGGPYNLAENFGELLPFLGIELFHRTEVNFLKQTGINLLVFLCLRLSDEIFNCIHNSRLVAATSLLH